MSHHFHEGRSSVDAGDGRPCKDSSEGEAGEVHTDELCMERAQKSRTQTARGGLDVVSNEVWYESQCDIVELEVLE